MSLLLSDKEAKRLNTQNFEREKDMYAKYTLTTLLLFLSVSLTSCTSQIPVATNYPYTEQQKMQAASHWNVLAADVVKQLKLNYNISKTTPLAIYPKFYLRDKEDPVIWTTENPLTEADESNRLITMPFKRAYQNYLIAQMVNAGYNIVDSKAKAKLLMIFDIQLIKHNDRRVRSPHIIRQLERIIAGAADGAYDDVKAGNYEVVITTSLKLGHTYIMCHTATYYINTPPWDSNYAIQGKVMEVTNQ